MLDSYGMDRKKSDNSLLMHSLYTVADIGKGKEVLKIYVEEMYDPTSKGTNKRAYKLTNIENASTASVRVQGQSLSSLTNTVNAIKNIADLFEFVKKYDDEFKPKSSSEIVNADGTPKLMYHGTKTENGDFYIFDQSKAKKKGGLGFKALGSGNYFTAKELDGTERYGSRVIKAYLDIKNPYKFYGGGSFKTEVCNALGLSEDISYDELQDEMRARGYDGVVQYGKNDEISIAVTFDSEQIKSVDNIGTFDKTNPDIRYSTKQKLSTKENFGTQDSEYLKAVENCDPEAVQRIVDEAAKAAGQKNNADDGVKYSFGVTQEEINDYVDNAYLKNNREDYKKYAAPSNRLISDLKNDLNLDGYIHAFRDNDIRHIKNSHGEDTNEKYPVTPDDIKKIPDIVQNYDKVYAKTNASGEPGIVYVKVGPENIVYYVEAVTTKYHNEKLLINKQMIKAGINEIPNLKGLIEAINKKESSSQYLADLQKIRKAYAQSVKENYSNNIIPNDSETVKQKLSVQASKETLSELKEKREGLVAEYRELRKQIDAIKESDEYKAFDNEVRTVRKNGSRFGGFAAVKEIRNRQKQWAEAAGLSALEERYDDISGQIHDYDLEIYKADKELKAKATAQLTEKVSKFSHNEIMDYAKKAAAKFGITKKFDNAGYMLPDGGLLDFSDGQGYRVLDHREIRDVLDFLPEDGNRSDGLIQFMNMGNIRMQIGGIDISRAPTKEQIAELRKFFDKNNGEITVDFSKDNGDNAGTLEYPEGTSSLRILNDIKKYFEIGELPQISATAAFHSMYSQKQQSGIEAYWAETLRENHSFRNIISLLGEMQIAGGKVQLNGRDVDRIAKDIISRTSSRYDKAQLTDELTVLYDYMANSGQNADTEEICTSLLNIAGGILEQSEMKDSELFDQYKNVRDYLRTQPIYITPAVKKEIESQFGSYKSFRNMLMGKVMRLSTVNEKAATLDEVWQELSELAPEYFPKDMNELDMPMQLTAFYESIAPKVVNPYEHFQENIEDAAAELATDIFQKYFEIGRLKTPQEKYRNLVFENMKKLEQSKKAMRQEFKQKAAQGITHKNRNSNGVLTPKSNKL